MGWNSGFGIMENTVVAVYNRGVLTKELLDEIMEPFKGTDCDTGGSNELLAKDGLCVEAIICKTMKPEEYADVMANPCYYDDFEENKDAYMSYPHWEFKANEKAVDLFYTIWRDQWGMW